MRPSGRRSSQENSISPGTSNAISAIITSAMPSMPSANWAPNAGIHSTTNSSWKRVPASAAGTE